MTEPNPLSLEERRDLKAFAEAATQGLWRAEGTIYEHMAAEIRCITPGDERGIAQVWQHTKGFADARFIAAANPSVVLRLLAALEEAEGRHDERDVFDAENEAAFADLDARIKGLEAELSSLTARAEKAEQQVAVDRNTFGHIRRHTQYPASGTLYDARNRLDHIAKLVDAALSPVTQEGTDDR